MGHRLSRPPLIGRGYLLRRFLAARPKLHAVREAGVWERLPPFATNIHKAPGSGAPRDQISRGLSRTHSTGGLVEFRTDG